MRPPKFNFLGSQESIAKTVNRNRLEKATSDSISEKHFAFFCDFSEPGKFYLGGRKIQEKNRKIV